MARGREKAAVQTAPVEGPWELPEGWRWTNLGRLLGGRSKSVTPSKFPDDVFELYSVPSFDSRSPEILTGDEIGSSKQSVTQGDVLLCKINPRINRAWVVGSPRGYPQIASTEWIRFACRENIDPHFLCHYLSTEALRSYLAMNASGVGGSLMRVKAATLNGYPIPVPPLETQRRIVAGIDELFSELDDGETALARAREDLEIYRKALLKAAVTGELTADWRAANPPQETGEQLLKRILAERRARWEADPKNKGKRYKEPAAPDTSGLPELPESWAWAALGQLIDRIEAGLNVKCLGRPPEDGETGIVKVSAVTWWDFDETASKTLISKNDYNPSSLIEIGDFLISRANTIELVGAPAIVSTLSKRLVLSDKVLRLVMPDTLKEWCFYVLRSPFGRQHIESRSTGNQLSMRNISQDSLRSLPIPMSPISELGCIINQLSDTTHAGSALLQQAVPIGEASVLLRQSILAAAFKGELVQ